MRVVNFFRSDTKVLKDGEDNKQKVYEALCVVTLSEGLLFRTTLNRYWGLLLQIV